jgi:serine/threonine protein kinase
MMLAGGSRLGPYEIVAPIGAGGTGEVYRARDTRLGRDVAIKVLPAEFASDPSRFWTSIMGLLPTMCSTSADASVVKRIAAPMIGGLVISSLLELLVYPPIHKLWKAKAAPVPIVPQ